MGVSLTGMEIIAFLLAALLAQDAPPIRTAPPVALPGQQLLQWTAQSARCDGRTVSARLLHKSHPRLVASTMSPQSPVTLRFRTDGDGRPLSIRSDEGANNYLSQDVVPSLAASTFVVDTPQAQCTIRYFPVRTPLEIADPHALSTYAMFPGTPVLPRKAWERTQPTDSNCADGPPPRVRVRAYPDFLSFPGKPGARDWAIMRYDLNASGRPINIAVLDDSGNTALNAASVRAVRASRFTPGARTGCTYRYWREAETINPPPSPDVATFRPAGATCPPKLAWTNRLSLVFPPPFLQRRVEGWAIVAYDVAPWGDVGNLRVMASEPAGGFGTQAMSILRQGKKPANGTGYTGCVEKVHFAIAGNDMGSAEDHAVAR